MISPRRLRQSQDQVPPVAALDGGGGGGGGGGYQLGRSVGANLYPTNDLLKGDLDSL